MKSKPCTMYIVRHGQSTYNRDKLLSGQVDPELTDEGVIQVKATAKKLKNVKFDAAFSSDLQRAAKTAGIIYGKPVPKKNQLKGLRERTFGSIDGKSTQHLIKLHAEQHEHYQSLTVEEQWRHKYQADMESDHDLSVRFITALEEIALKYMGKTVLVGAHGGTIRTTLIKLGYLTPAELGPGSFKNAGYIKLSFENGEFFVKDVFGLTKPEL